MSGRDRDADLELARARLKEVLAATRRKRDAAAPDTGLIVSEAPRTAPRWVLAALIALAVIAAWKLLPRVLRPDPPAPAMPAERQAQAAASGAASDRIQRPDWVRLPSGEDIARHYPPLAQLQGKEGRAVIRCQVTAAGTLDRCEVVEEQPAGLGFGKAALSMSAAFQMRPAADQDERPVEGASVTIPIRFQLS